MDTAKAMSMIEVNFGKVDGKTLKIEGNRIIHTHADYGFTIEADAHDRNPAEDMHFVEAYNCYIRIKFEKQVSGMELRFVAGTHYRVQVDGEITQDKVPAGYAELEVGPCTEVAVLGAKSSTMDKDSSSVICSLAAMRF